MKILVTGSAGPLGEAPTSPLAQAIGAKGYHPEVFRDGPYPVES